MARILVVDDDPAIREMVALTLEKSGLVAVRASGVRAARAALASSAIDLVVCDIYMPGENGLDLLAEVRHARPDLPVILMTARGTIETATLASRIGAFDYLAKPFDLGALLDRVRAALAPAGAPGVAVEAGPASMIVGSHPAIVEVYKAVARVAPLAIPVLVLGETGTGKELVARALHRFGAHPDGPFVPVNCGAIPDTLLESELFGHVRGAFTDARRDRRGALALADGGTVFLDEVGDVSPAFQVKLLRFLQDGVVRPVGADTGEVVHARVVAATHREPRLLVAAGAFREDLYYRHAGYEIRLPPLRERLSDLPLLVDHFSRQAAAELGIADPGPAGREVLAALAAHPWRGNVRELEQAVRRALIDSRGLADATVMRRVLAELSPPDSHESSAPSPTTGLLEDAERKHILAVLAATAGNRSAAARILGIERKTLSRKLKRFGIEVESDQADGRDEP
ncbi:MAG: sigma-54-dependent Fis family transcriptional regulator [Acidobacteria bacterium]|nr:sigma-54-dependent Fis family transcriptional regulator [Acidobacteriota bacterium]